MNSKTANHLNHLRNLAASIEVITQTPKSETEQKTYPAWMLRHKTRDLSPLVTVLQAILTSVVPAAQEAEIREAAREEREAVTGNAELYYQTSNARTFAHEVTFRNSYQSDGRFTEYGSSIFDRRVLQMAQEQIDAAIARDDAEHRARYLRYRKACLQGVAVPPAE